MITNLDPRELADALCTRSQCSVQVAAVLADRRGVFAWGWNSQGLDGFGEHAEAHAIRRGNPRRYGRAVLTVAAVRAKNGKRICSSPCVKCRQRIVKAGISTVEYRLPNGHWVREDL